MMFSEIIKIILFIVIALLGVIIILIAAACLYPLKYTVNVKAAEKHCFEIQVNASAFLSAFSCAFRNKKIKTDLRICGRTVRKKASKKKVSGDKTNADAEKAVTKKNSRTDRVRKTAEEICAEKNRKVLKKSADLLYKLSFIIKPEGLKGRIKLGFETPDITAIAYSLAASVTAEYGEGFLVIPDMENKVFEADVHAEGKAVPGYILYLISSYLLDSNVRSFMKKVRSK